MATSVKDAIADLLRADGMDFMSAYEWATRYIREVKALPPGEYTYRARSGRAITIRRA